jgi:hypothetical protein
MLLQDLRKLSDSGVLSESIISSDSLTRKATKFRYITESAVNITDGCDKAKVKVIYIFETICSSAASSFSKPFHRIFGQNRASGF